MACVIGVASARPAAADQPFAPVDREPLAGAAVAADSPEALDAAWSVLRAGGTAVDAALAGAFVLSVTMPEAVSIAGAGAALRYDGKGRHITAYVGREISSGAVEPDWLGRIDGRPAPPLSDGRAVGAPTLLQMLKRMHAAGGRLDWARLTAAAERHARNGIPITARTAAALGRIYFPINGAGDRIFGGSGPKAQPAGTVVRNPDLADVLAAIGRDGADVLSGGVVGRNIVEALREPDWPGRTLTLDELARAEPSVVPPACVALPFAGLCAPPSPTLGPTALEAVSLFLAAVPPAPDAFTWANTLTQAHRLAIADANRYLGDPRHVVDLMPDLLTTARIGRRARMISQTRVGGLPAAERLSHAPPDLIATPSHRRLPPVGSIIVVDGEGDAVALSLTLSQPFGSGIISRGVVLNAANASFDAPPPRPGYRHANAIGPGRRPRLDVSPVMALDQDRRLLLAATSGGGDDAPAFLAKTVVAALGLQKSAASAVAAPNVSSANRMTDLERMTIAERLKEPLEDIGHHVRVRPLDSGLLAIVRGPDGAFAAAADPRGDGAARVKAPADAPALDSPKRGS